MQRQRRKLTTKVHVLYHDFIRSNTEKNNSCYEFHRFLRKSLLLKKEKVCCFDVFTHSVFTLHPISISIKTRWRFWPILLNKTTNSPDWSLNRRGDRRRRCSIHGRHRRAGENTSKLYSWQQDEPLSSQEGKNSVGAAMLPLMICDVSGLLPGDTAEHSQ